MDFLNGSVKVARFLDIEIRVHILFLIWIGFRLTSAGADWQSELAFLAMLFGIVLVHEYGHCLGARSVGGDARLILMWPLGGLAFAHAPMRPWPQFVTVACGPLVNVVFCVVSAAILIVATGNLFVCSPNPFHAAPAGPLFEQWQRYVWLFYYVNLMLLSFNLLPVFPLDGGQLLQAILWPWLGLQRSSIIAAQLGIVGAIGLAWLGITHDRYMLLGIALFGGLTSYQHFQAARYGMLQEDLGAFEHVRRVRRPRGPGFFGRLFRWRSRPVESSPLNPNPGAWKERLSEEQKLEAEVDRILKKVHDQGIQSLSYVEQQTLERVTRLRQRREPRV